MMDKYYEEALRVLRRIDMEAADAFEKAIRTDKDKKPVKVSKFRKYLPIAIFAVLAVIFMIIFK